MLKKESKFITKAFENLGCNNLERYKITPKTKNQSAAKSARLEGNKLFQQKNHDIDAHENIWEKYTLSIALAPTGSETLAMAYGNRSALLFHISKFKDCIVDVDRAVGITKSNELKIKLLCRKAKCFHALDDLPIAEKSLQEAKLCIDPDAQKDKELLKFLDLIEATEKVLSTKYSEPSGSGDEHKTSALTIETDDFSNVTDVYNSKFGRHLVATRDIAPGEVVFVEKPYCMSILHFKSAYPFCTHCHAACLTTIPCDSCIVAMYCSEKCKNEAWKQYHDVGCSTFSDCLKEEVANNSLLMINECIITECRKAGGIANFRTLLESIEKKKGKTSEKLIINGKLKSSQLKFELWFNSKQLDVPFDYSEDSLFLVLSTVMTLVLSTSFFGKKYTVSEIKNLANNKDVVFIGSLLLRICRLAATTTLPKRTNILRKARVRNCNMVVGDCISSIFTFTLTHNCDPNVEKTYNEANDLVLFALKPIKKDDPIFLCYCESYASSQKIVRQLKLLESAIIDCDCQACEEDWPPMSPAAAKILIEKPKAYEKLLFKTATELELFKKHKSVIEALFDFQIYDFHCTEQMLEELAKSVSIALSQLPQPSLITSLLIKAIHIVCQVLYSYTYPVQDKCVNNKNSF